MVSRLRALRPLRRANRLTTAFLVGGIAFIALYFGALSQDAQDIAYQVPGMAAPLAVIAGVLIYRPSDKWSWIILAAGLTFTVAGDWTWVVLDLLGLELFPSVADAFYLIGLVLVAVAILRLVSGRIPGGDRAGMIDAVIVAVGVGLISWTFLMEPLVADPMASMLDIGVALAYPLLDLLLLGVLVRLFLVPGRRVPSLLLLLGALVLLLLADFPYAVMSVEGGYETGHIVEIGWLAASVLWGAAALHPSMRRVAEPVEASETQLPPWRLALLAGASLMAPGVLVIDALTGRPVDVPVVAAGCVILFLLVIARLGGLVSDLRMTLHERHNLERELERRALHDPLTGLPNRVLFYDRLEHALMRRGEQAAVLFLDLDDFKNVNDTFGHQAGDELLTRVAEAIRSAVRPSDTVARLGGDEFAVLLDHGAAVAPATLVAGRVLTAISAPTTVGQQERSIGASIGISVGMSGMTTAETLMREADIAMYVAKSQGKGTHSIFDPKTHERVVRTMGLQADLERGLREQQFELQYQPVMHLQSGEVAGVEALLRWRHPARGLLDAEDFIRLAEANGAIIPLGRWVLEEIGRQLTAWSSSGPTTHGRFISVNLSAAEVASPGVVDLVATMLASAPIRPDQLLVEVSESVQPDADAVATALASLKRLGVRLAIDDFGMGFASVSSLLRNQFDVIKIDQSLVAGMQSDPRAASLVSGVIDLARGVGAITVAEGIEDAHQLAELRQMGCDLGQGFHFAPAMPPAELEAALGMEGTFSRNATRRPFLGRASAT